MDLYPVEGLQRPDVGPDVYGLGGPAQLGRPTKNKFSGFMSVKVGVPEHRPWTVEPDGFSAETTAAVPSAAPGASTAEIVKEAVTRKVREKVGPFVSASDFMEPGLFGLGAGFSTRRPAGSEFSAFSSPRNRGRGAKETARQAVTRKVREKLSGTEPGSLTIAQFTGLGSKVKDKRENLRLRAEAAAVNAEMALRAAIANAKIAAVTAGGATAALQLEGKLPMPGSEVPAPALPVYQPPVYQQPVYQQPMAYQQAMSYQQPVAYDAALDSEVTAYGQEEFDISGAPEVPSYDQPQAPIMSEGDEDAGYAEEDGGLFGLRGFGDVEVGKDGFMRVSMADGGLPRGTRPVREDKGEQQSAIVIDKRFRPEMLTDLARVGLPYKTGEGMQRLRRFDEQTVEVMDPSVMELTEEDVVGRAGTDRVDFFSPMQFMGMGGLGQLPTAKDTAVNGAMLALANVAQREAQLQQYNPAAYDSFMLTYSAIRASINTTFAALQAATELDLAKSLTITAQIAMYKNALDQAVSQAKPKVVQAKAPTVTQIIREVPKAVKETVFSKYGMYVIGGGALLVGGLVVLNMVMKRRKTA